MSMKLSKTSVFRLATICVMLCLWGQSAYALEIPPTGSAAFLQTSGPVAGLGIGDYYTSVDGEPIAANRFHRMEIYVPCAWPGASTITFGLYDPESSDPDPIAPPAKDEVRGTPNNTTYTLRAPGGGTIAGPITFLPAGGTNGLWVELLTFTPATAGFGCGTYVLTNTTDTGNDDNAWRLRVVHDPDCTVTPGTCSTIGALSGAPTTGLMDNGNETNDIDGIAGTGDELVAGLTRTSYQHNGASCQDFYQFVDGVSPTITLNNFDLDSPGLPATITYFPPDGSTATGVASGIASWNGDPVPDNSAEVPNPPRFGDPFTITPALIGWWRTQVCVGATDNQYIFEGLEDQPVFFQPVPFPNMTINKDDGRTVVSSTGETVTYTIQYANMGNGAAIDATIVDTLPAGATFISCTDQAGIAGNCSGTGPVTWNLGVVPAGGTGSVTLTVNLPAASSGSTHTNTVSIDYTDIIGNNYPPVTDTDIDNVVAATPTPTLTPTATSTPTPNGTPATPGVGGTPAAGSTGTPGTPQPLLIVEDPFITKSVEPPFALPGEIVTWTIKVKNPGTITVNNVVVTDDMPAEVEILSVSPSNGTITFSGQTVTIKLASLTPGQEATFQVRARVRITAKTPYIITNQACLTFDQDTGKHCASASVISATQVPATGESPWSRWRVPLFLVLLGSVIAGIGFALRLTDRPARHITR